MLLNEIGKITERCWKEIPNHFRDVELDHFICMPNHVHGIIVIYPKINNVVGVQNFEPLQNKYQHIIPQLIESIVRGFKSGVTKWCRKNTEIQSVWQRNYYEHVIRSEEDLNKIRRYIINNPPKWEYDQENRFGKSFNEKRKFWLKFLNEFEESG